MSAPRLPIDDVLPAVRDALRTAGRVVLVAPPGAGKTTRVPLALRNEPWCTGRILVLEPRRLAARAAAHHMARLLGEEVGGTGGYRVHLESRVSARTRVEVITEGVLTRMLRDDATLDGVSAVLFDEFHERSLHADLGLALALHRVARETKTTTLFVPAGGRGFVDPRNGTLDLSRILVPVAHEPSAQAALDLGARGARLGAAPVEFVLLHVGDGPLPSLEMPQDPRFRFREESRHGRVVDQIELAARELEVDLIAMTTDGRDGFLGTMGRGSHTEQVVRQTPCPVLSVPVEKT